MTKKVFVNGLVVVVRYFYHTHTPDGSENRCDALISVTSLRLSLHYIVRRKTYFSFAVCLHFVVVVVVDLHEEII